jgi:pyruvate dehydrogenase E2 component (dihydrolipoamide acetyltransferase)
MGIFKLPDLGEGLTEAEILAWHVKPGDRVVVDQPMVSVETAKAVVEVPVPFGGSVIALHAAVGEIVATGAPLIEFDAGTVVGTMPAAEADWAEPAVTAGVPRGPQSRPRAAPVARALAKRLALDLAGLSGSGPDGVITLDDVIARAGFAGTTAPAPPASAPAHSTTVAPAALAATPLPATSLPLRGARRGMAHSMSLSRDQVAGSTVCDDADLHAWTQPRDHMPRLIRAMGVAAQAEPALNAWFDQASQSRRLFDHVDLAVAVDTPDGLLVPVLRNIHGQSLDALRAGMAECKAAAHRRSSTPAELADFTLMLSNFGTLAGRYGIPLVVPPAVAILGAGRVREDAVVVAGAVTAHRRMPLSLSFDHRCVTGGEACRFLAAVMADLEKPD